ncbi:MAG: ATP-binding cassette domain-containing protein [Bacteroidota bacterium]
MDQENSLVGKPLKRFFRLLSLERKEIGHIYIYAIFNGLIYLSLPLGIQAIISQVLANELSSSWVLLIIVVTLGTAVVGGLQIMQMSITEMIQQRIFTRASFEFAYRIPRIKMEALAKYYPPELVNRFFDTMNVQKGLPKILIDLSTAAIQIIFGLILLSFYHPFFIIFGFVLVFLLFLIFRFTGPRGLTTSLEESNHKYEVASWLEEIARALSSFKLAGETDLALRKTDHLVSNYLNARKKHFRVLIAQFSNIVAFKTIVTAGLLILGSILLIERRMNVGQFVASEIIILMVISSVEKLITSMETIYDVLTGMEKIGKVTDLPLERHKGMDFEQINTGQGIDIQFKNVDFKFPYDHHLALKNVSFDILPGEKVCISGPSGSGKSMLLNVISGLYEHYNGIIAFNDVPLMNLDPISLRSYIGDCLSQKTLFRGSVIENLKMGSPEVSFEDVQWALSKLELHDFVNSLPMGLETDIVPETPTLPQSVVRKLILARCVAKRPQLLVMDDFFSIWEKDERERICEFLTCAEMRTVVSVSNDPTFAVKCDKVIVLEKGAIRDVGSFQEISQKPYFENLFK